MIEMLVNGERQACGKRTVPFMLTDLTPNLDAWMPLTAKSINLSFIPQPVDAAFPKFSVISATTSGDKEAARRQGFESDGHKVFRLFCSTFHHFDNARAVRALKSTMDTSDGFAIVELQERRILSLLMVFLESWILLAMSVFWFWDDPVHLFFQPLLSFIYLVDGLASCLRTRTFAEIIELAAKVTGQDMQSVLKGSPDNESVRIGNWVFRSRRMLHTWPAGNLTVIVGKCIPRKDGVYEEVSDQ